MPTDPTSPIGEPEVRELTLDEILALYRRGDLLMHGRVRQGTVFVPATGAEVELVRMFDVRIKHLPAPPVVRAVRTTDFAGALHEIRMGRCLTRRHWGNAASWVTIWTAGTYKAGSELLENAPRLAELAVNTRSGSVDVAPCLVRRASDGALHWRWVPTTEDLLANDWFEVPHVFDRGRLVERPVAP